MDLFIILTLEEEVSVLGQNSRSVSIYGMDICDLCGSVGSCVSLCLPMLIEESA